MTSILLLLLISSALAAPPKLSLVEPTEPVEPEEILEIGVTDGITAAKKNSGENFLEKHQKFLSWLDFFDDAPPNVQKEAIVIAAEDSDDKTTERQEQSAVRGHRVSVSSAFHLLLDFNLNFFSVWNIRK